MVYLRALLTILLVLTVIPFLLVAGVFPGLDPRLRVRQLWVKMILFVLGVRLKWEGTVPVHPAILVANHRSYLDPLLLLTRVKALPVAKAEMARWPLIGTAARLSGIFFVQRDKPKDRARTLDAIGRAVLEGHSILIFPEGTTHDRPGLLPFRKGIFQVAARTGIPVVPVALEFEDPADFWIGDDTFVAHFFRRFGKRNTRAAVSLGPVLQGADPVALMEEAHAWISGHLPVLRQHMADRKGPAK